MAGRLKQPLYHYSAEGKFLGKFESQAKLKELYFKNSQYPLFTSNVIREGITRPKEYDILPDGTYIAKYAIGRDKLMREIKIDNNVFCKTLKGDRAIEVFNLLGEKIAEFKNIRVLLAMTGKDGGTLQSRLKVYPVKRNKDNKDTLKYKYKTK